VFFIKNKVFFLFVERNIYLIFACQILRKMTHKYDFLVIGSGVAGMSYALKVAEANKGRIAIICKTTLEEANTTKAQGGIAAVTNLIVDNFEKHIEDTMIAGDWINDPEAVRQVVTGGPDSIRDLVKWGVNFDKGEDGAFDLHREGGHSEFRILHHADDTGAEIQRGLMEAVRNHPNIDVFEHYFAVEIITQHHLGIRVTRRTPDIVCYGAYVLNPKTGKVDTFLSKVTLMATGGTGAIYATTSNPNIATGDGIAMVYRAKGKVKDMEFVQFHPTVLYNPSETHPAYLITEAMRGYGGILRLPNGKEFMQKYDERLSLAPRDIVARAIDNEMKIHALDHVCLDVTHKDPEETKHHFPNIYAKCLSIGIDITKDYIPVAPSAHYMCGGIKVDLDGQSSIRRLYAVGECSCTGLHGGNRLASNSLTEAVVYADAAAKHSLEVIDQYNFNDKVPEWNDEGTMTNEEKVLIAQDVKEVGQIMSTYVGIVRSDIRLHRAWERLDLLYEETEHLFKRVKPTRDICELRNMINVGYLITRQALERKESRGLHYTVDYAKHALDEKK
jgi:L-aspartate oxidase